MSIIPPGLSRNLQFYLSGPLPCPYLPAQVERKLFTRLDNEDSAANVAVNAALCRAGFRRSHDVVYRPACNSCNACVPIRIPVDVFEPAQSFRRVVARNQDLHWQRRTALPDADLFALFSLYQNTRHSDSDMARMTYDDFVAMLVEGQADTHLYELRDGSGLLKGCMLADPVGDGFSAVYSFFAPQEPQRSLGTFMVLCLVEEAKKCDLPFVYLGYWVEASRKMSYKSRFKPLQCLGANGWEWMP